MLTRKEDDCLLMFDSFDALTKQACLIRCVETISKDVPWLCWAGKWLSGEDRSTNTLTVIEADTWDRLDNKSLEWQIVWGVRWALHETVFTKSIPVLGSIVGDYIGYSGVISVLTTYFICPHCHKQPDQHTKGGTCLFGAHHWDNIDKAWNPKEKILMPLKSS